MTDQNMGSFAVEVLSAPGEPLATDALGPEWLFAEAIRSEWKASHPSGVVVDASLDNRVPPDWVLLGNFLLRSLQPLGAHVGVAIEGTCPREILLRWEKRIQFTGLNTILAKKLDTVRHPLGDRIGERVIGINAIWIAYTPRADSRWLSTIWCDTGSHLFDMDCDMLVSFYEEPAVPDIDWDEPLTLKLFEERLDRAVAWVTPLDGNIGFIVGLPSESDVHRKLIAAAKS
jgi:hypothetical protein